MKKHFFTLILLFALLLTILPVNASASTNSEIIYQDDDFIVTSTLTTYESPSSIRLFSTTQTKSVSKTLTISNKSGTTLATYTLYGTFSYNGKSASCTKASYSSSIKKAGWSFSSKTASKSTKTATGSYTLKNSSTTKKYSGSTTISCSKNGTIS